MVEGRVGGRFLTAHTHTPTHKLRLYVGWGGHVVLPKSGWGMHHVLCIHASYRIHEWIISRTEVSVFVCEEGGEWVCKMFICICLFRVGGGGGGRRQNGIGNRWWSSQVSFQTAHLKRDLNFDHRGFPFPFRRQFRVLSFQELAVHVFKRTGNWKHGSEVVCCSPFLQTTLFIDTGSSFADI